MSKRYQIALALFLVTIFNAWESRAQLSAQDPNAQWYEPYIRKGEKVLDASTIAPGQEKTYSITSNKPLVIGFSVHTDYNKVRNYMARNKQVLSIGNDDNSCSSTSGCGMPFAPINGKISVTVKNICEEAYEMVITSHDP